MRKDSFDNQKIRVPRDTRNLSISAPDNFNLKYNRFARYEHNELKFKFFYIEKAKDRGHESYEIQAGNYGGLNWKDLCARLRSAAESLLPAGAVQVHHYRPHWRWVTGLGGASVYETGIELHHIYGFPYIPASTLKGALRSYIIREAFESDEKEAFQDKAFCEWFGCPKESVGQKALAGKFLFFDAFPLSAPKLVTDIMNPHYSAYYSKGQPPADYLSPTPIPFLTVTETDYQFITGYQSRLAFEQLKEKTIVQWLKEALADGGLGAKTAVGYGYFLPTQKS
jgi:CRISPR-associated protein Cmr6